MALVTGGYAPRQGRALQLLLRTVLRDTDTTLLQTLDRYARFYSYDTVTDKVTIYKKDPKTHQDTGTVDYTLYTLLVDYSAYIEVSSVQTNNNVIMTQDSMNFNVTLNEELPTPRVGMEVIWRLWDYAANQEVNREYGGVITSVKETTYGTSLEYAVNCESYLRWFDRKLVTGYYQQAPAETVIQQVVSKYCPGFEAKLNTEGGTVEKTGLYIVPQYFNYQRPSQAIKLVADQVQRGWYIDYYRKLHFFRYEGFPTPLPGNTLDVDNDVVSYGDLELAEDGEQVYNRFTIRGYKERSPNTYTLTYVADGDTHQWSLGYRVSSAKGDVVVKVTAPGGAVSYPAVKKDVLDGIPGQGGDPSVVYIHFTQHLIRFAIPPDAGTRIDVTFYYLIDKKRTDQYDKSVAYMKAIEGDVYSDGVYEYATFDKSLTNSTMESVTAKLEILAYKYGTPTLRGNFKSYVPGWRAGQSFSMSTKRMGGIKPKDGAWYVHRVSKRWIQGVQQVDPNNPKPWDASPIEYTIECANKPYMV